jgi:uncharacterized protein YbbC (DUF1343 family)
MVKTGLDILNEQSFNVLSNLSVGILCNQSAINKESKHIIDLIRTSNSTVKIKAILTPEHGSKGVLQDGEDISLEEGENIYPLYDKNFIYQENLDIFKELDAIVVDLQDIGIRFYTFSQTLAELMKTAKKYNLPLFLLDRPNPLNANDFEGTFIQNGYESFIGRAPLLQRHGLTFGEIATVFNLGALNQEPINCDLKVISMEDYDRKLFFNKLNLPWIKPSPNIMSLEAIVTYGASCMIEATEFSEGRGTELSFIQFGGPDFSFKDFIKSYERLDQYFNNSFEFPETTFTPKENKFKNQKCLGSLIKVKDREKFNPIKTGILIITSLSQSHPKYFKKILSSSLCEITRLDKFYGSNLLRKVILNTANISEVFEQIKTDTEIWGSIRKKFLLY